MTTPAEVSSVLSRISAGAASAAVYVPGPWGIALAIAGAATGIAADVVRGQQAPVVRATDPDALLDAMAARWAAKRKAGGA
jgi:hypothetical protein